MKIKSIKLLSIILSCLTITTAYSQNSNNVSLSKQAVLGKWNINSIRSLKKVDGKLERDTAINNLNSSVEFREDGTVYKCVNGDCNTLQYSINANQIIINNTLSNKQNVVSVSALSANKLVIVETIIEMDRSNKIVYESTTLLTR